MARMQDLRRIQAPAADGGDFLGGFKGGGESLTNGNIIDIMCAESGPLRNMLSSLDLSSRCSTLSRALSSEYADKSAGLFLGGSSSFCVI
jgi:hypothetical protein